MNHTKTTGIRRHAGALALALCLALSLLSALSAPARAAFSDGAMDKLHNWGVIGGYPDGSLRPERNLTRAEFVAMVNRAYGYTNAGETPFIDVPANAWYHDDIGAAYNAGYFTGYSPRMAHPDDELTREQAVVLLARNMRLDPIQGEVTEFSDGRDCAEWSRGYIRAAQQSGMIGGYPDGSYKPQNNITRGEMAVMLQRALGTLVNKPGVHTLSDVYGNVTISTPNTTLKDSTIAGDLYITGGLDLGDITLENVRVLGNIIVAGGGESQSGEDSIILRNVVADSLLVDSIADQFVTVRAEGDTDIAETVLRSDSFVQDRTRPGQGLLNISLESPDPAASFTLSGNLETVINKTPGSTLTVAMGTVDSLTVDEKARDATLNLDINSTARELNLDVATNVTGVGDIDKLYVNAAGSAIEMLPDTITIRPGLTANIAGEDLNAAQAIESSSDPRLLAGYPRLKNIAPTSAVSYYSANKAGTVYWAVSSTTDGSIPEDELIDPTEDNTRIALNGSLPIEESNKEFTAALEQLLPDSNYYLSTVMVDARDRHSPVKVAAFTTPDNTVPAFTQGYPRIVRNWSEMKVESQKDANGDVITDENGDPVPVRVPYFYAQAGVMTNKSCQLYYALYPAGSAQPTGQQFRTGSLGRPIQSGVEDVTKNVIWLRTFSGLSELTSYDLYVWLTDADGARSSSVQKLTFSTIDGTAPHFQYETPMVVGNPPATSIPTMVNISEAGTVYWAIVKHGDDFIKASTGNVESPKSYIESLTASSLANALEGSDASRKLAEEQTRELDILKRKIESGSGSVHNGSVTATESRDTDVNITNLTAETAYDIYYVIKDRAGNYSDISVLENIKTLDTNPPYVEPLVFSRSDKGEPLANTDIDIVFSEDVQQYPTKLGPGGTPLTLASFSNVGPNSTEEERVAMAEFLSGILSIYNDSGSDPTKAAEPYLGPDSAKSAADWLIDFRRASITPDPDTGKVTVTLGSDTGAINLKSDSTYHFVYNNVQDLATTPNRMRNMPVSSELFHTVGASVLLSTTGIDATTVDGNPADGTNEVDMVFSLFPKSINVENSVRWDMLLWSDSTAEFDLYSRKQGTETWTKIQPADASSPSNSIAVAEGSGEFMAKSLYAHFLKQDPEPVNSLTETTEYAIHFTKIGNSSNRANWNKEVTFKVSVIVGTAQNLSGLTRSEQITQTAWGRAQGNGVKEINNYTEGYSYFRLNQSFTDSRAPELVGTYPSFSLRDSSAEISVMLDRPGTVYYIIAPFTYTDYARPPEASWPSPVPSAETVNGSFSVKYGTPGDEATLRAYFTPTGGDEYLISEGGTALTGGRRVTVSSPSWFDVLNGPFSPQEKHGSYHVQSTRAVESFPVTGLTAETNYLAYFVFVSDGGKQSDYAVLYQFRTPAQKGPILDVTRASSTSVRVTSTDVDAIANYALFYYRQSDLPEIFKEALSNVLETGKALPAAYSSLTVLEAMGTKLPGGVGYVFDEYASATTKNNVYQEIVHGTPGGGTGYFSGLAGQPLVRGVPDLINCYKTKEGERGFEENILPGTPFCFVVVAAVEDSATGHSLGFGAAYPIQWQTTDPPRVTAVSYNLTAHYNATATDYYLTGTIDLTFDQDLYYYDDSTSPATTRRVVKGSNTDRAYINVASLVEGRPSNSLLEVETSNTAGDTRSIRTITLVLNAPEAAAGVWPTGGIKSADYITFTRLICSQNSDPGSLPLRVSLLYNASAQTFNTSITSLWYPTENIDGILQFDGLKMLTGLELNKQTLELSVGGANATLTATITPSDVMNVSYNWTADTAGVVSISGSGKTVTVSGIGIGTAIITCTASTPTGSVSATCSATVSSPIKNLALTPSPELTLSVGSMSVVTASAESADPNVFIVPIENTQWSLVGDSTRVTLTSTTGREIFVTGRTKGEVYLQASLGGLTARVKIIVE